MKKNCKKCDKVQEVIVLYEKRYQVMQVTTRVVECTVCKDKFLDIDKEAKQLDLFKTA